MESSKIYDPIDQDLESLSNLLEQNPLTFGNNIFNIKAEYSKLNYWEERYKNININNNNNINEKLNNQIINNLENNTYDWFDIDFNMFYKEFSLVLVHHLYML